MNTKLLVRELSLSANHQYGYVIASATTKTTLSLDGWKGVTADSDKNKVDFLHIDGKIDFPVYQFWCFREVEMMADNCHILFTNVKDSTTWKDLVDCYGGLRFGSLFLMVYRKSTRVGVFPSQRGMYMK